MIRTSQKIRMIKLSDIMPNPYQTRRNFEKEGIEALAASFLEVGVLSPIIVRRGLKGFEIVCGQRRVRAAIIAKLSQIPAIIISAGDAQCAEISIIENIHRKQLGLFEEAEGYYNLMMFHRVKKEKLIKALSANSFKINEKVRFLSLKEKVRYKIEAENISENIVRELLRIHNEEKQLEIIEKIVKENISQKEVEKFVESVLHEDLNIDKPCEKNKRKPKEITAKMPLYINTIKKTIDILKKHGAKVEFIQNESDDYTEFVIKTFKKAR